MTSLCQKQELCNLRYEVGSFQERNNPRLVPDMEGIIERLKDVPPEDKVFLGFWVGVAIDVDNLCCRVGGGGTDVAFGDRSDCLDFFERRVLL